MNNIFRKLSFSFLLVLLLYVALDLSTTLISFVSTGEFNCNIEGGYNPCSFWDFQKLYWLVLVLLFIPLSFGLALIIPWAIFFLISYIRLPKIRLGLIILVFILAVIAPLVLSK